MKRMIEIVSVLLIVSFVLTQLPITSFGKSAKSSENRIMVSMGDSYSSGEGVEPFYYQGESERKRSTNPDFLAHRSESSWPGLLKLNGVSNAMRNHRNNNWYFVAASGAETKDFQGSQMKDYSRNDIGICFNLEPQLKVFEQFEKNEVDFVTMTIGGNDVGFGKIITNAVTSSKNHKFTNPCSLADQLNNAWKKYYNGTKKDPVCTKDKIQQAYKDVRSSTGDETSIIVAGYPKLIEIKHDFQIYFSEYEAALIDKNVSKFNQELEGIVSSLNDENFYFVSVEEAFDGHGAYSKNGSYINGIIKNKKYDLKEIDIHDLSNTLVSAYSMHPNEKGVEVYRTCVQSKIDEIEKAKGQVLVETTTKPTTTKADIKEEVNWRQAYIDYLKKYMNEVDNPESCGFSLVYIDNDDTPELVIRDGNDHCSGASVYTCVNSKVVTLVEDLGGTFGFIGYVERKGLIYRDVIYQGRGTTTIYKIEAGTCKKLISLYSDGAATPEGMTPDYKINDKSVSKKEYDEAWAEYENNNLSYSSDDDMALSLDAIESINNY